MTRTSPPSPLSAAEKGDRNRIDLLPLSAAERGLGGEVFVGRAFRVILVVALVIMPLVGHGCHSDDADQEPGFIPPPRPPGVEFPGSDARPTPHRR